MPRCKNCNQKFKPIKFLQKYCTENEECIAAFVQSRKSKFEAERKKEQNKQTRQQKEALLTKGEWLNLLQKLFNAYIRLRDKDLPCISCGTKKPVKYDAGHYWATTYSYLRFNEDNVHKQCSKNCNMEKHGNQGEYRIRLIKRIGLERVEKLDADRHKELHLTIPEIKELIAVYKKKTKDLLQNK